jgi:hypothetical protein
MDVNASCSNFLSLRLHNHMGVSTLALGSPFSTSNYSFGHAVSLHGLKHSNSEPHLRVFGDSSRPFGIPSSFSYVLLFRPSPFPLPNPIHLQYYRNWNAARNLHVAPHQVKTSAVVQRLLSGSNGPFGCV